MTICVLLLALAASGWTDLFNGRSLEGLQTTGASWTVENGIITGRQGPGGTAGDLLSAREYTDFELEAEWQMKWPGNSGIWFRYKGPNTGCQADILDQSTHPGILSGSLYCIGRDMIAGNRDAASVNKTGWNTTVLRARGDLIEITQNGRVVVSAREGAFLGKGRVGFQLHGGKEFEGMEIRIRKLRIREL